MTSHSKETEKEKNLAPASEQSFVVMNKNESHSIKADPLLNKEVAEDSFTILTTEDLNELGLENLQIFTIGAANEGVETFTVYSSESNNDQLSLLSNSSIPLSAISL